MRVLITGGLGFLGSITAAVLHDNGFTPIIIDNLANSSLEVLDELQRIVGSPVKCHIGSIDDSSFIRGVLLRELPSLVIHFAGDKSVAESVAFPLGYYANNVGGTLSLLQVMAEVGVRHIVFSSSAAVYGVQERSPISEWASRMPASPYGRTKAMVEDVLEDLCRAGTIDSAVALRYFNPVGAHSSGVLGENPIVSHGNLMPAVVKVARGEARYLDVFGADYPTPDGTCVRDYVHVMDVAEGHVMAAQYAMTHAGYAAANLGTGRGVSVMELLQVFAGATGVPVAFRMRERRPGDVAELYADVGRSEALFGWKATRSLEAMCRDAWQFALAHHGHAGQL